MRIEVVGGGPGGLYFGILMKQAFPEVAIVVHERNRPEDTFGFGVVFSEETLSFLDDADPESAAEIRGRFRWWRDIETSYRGTRVVSTGHGFAALSRTVLLAILQRRARALGCELRFEDEVADVDALAAGADLLVGCDGVNSLVRDRFAESFAPRVELGACRFSWLGTTLPLEAFSFFFAETRSGLFQAHAYPFDERRSTFIVEAHEETWRDAGLDEADEERTVAACESIFAEHLGGHRLLANRSIWRRFPTVTCGSWRHGQVVLLGDAAHTAHFSIGSGTKLAMEDAIALVAALREVGTADVPRALAAYEGARRLDVAKLQRAARTSESWFEHSRRYLGQHPLAFSFNLMTRSKRITYDNLAARDPELVARVNRWYREAHGPPPDGGTGVAAEREREAGTAAPPMFTPFRTRALELRNRIVVSPMCQYSAVEGRVGEWHLVHLGSRAMGGAGLVVAEMTDVSPEGRITHGCAGLYAPEHVAAWRRIVRFVHEQTPAAIGIQLAHAGRKGSMRHDWSMTDVPLGSGEGAWETLAPSAFPFRPGWPSPREMGRGDMDRVRDAFVRATGWAAEAGFDWLELHAAHGYLISSFLSPLANLRRDDHGGSLENRMRFPLEVFRAMRDAWPASKPMSVRVSATDWMPDGGGT
ncbi:MAG TPA: FAD-dependent monooxygenase, partial [Gaiellaceae bacterium]|nr:FAD-dependent monooxygenase [Gaiellaceae bacterium]